MLVTTENYFNFFFFNIFNILSAKLYLIKFLQEMQWFIFGEMLFLNNFFIYLLVGFFL